MWEWELRSDLGDPGGCVGGREHGVMWGWGAEVTWGGSGVCEDGDGGLRGCRD